MLSNGDSNIKGYLLAGDIDWQKQWLYLLHIKTTPRFYPSQKCTRMVFPKLTKLWKSNCLAWLYHNNQQKYVFWLVYLTCSHKWLNPTKPGTSCKTCFWVNSHKRWLAQNYFQIFICIFILIKWGMMFPFKCLKESIQMRFFFTQ